MKTCPNVLALDDNSDQTFSYWFLFLWRFNIDFYSFCTKWFNDIINFFCKHIFFLVLQMLSYGFSDNNFDLIWFDLIWFDLIWFDWVYPGIREQTESANKRVPESTNNFPKFANNVPESASNSELSINIGCWILGLRLTWPKVHLKSRRKIEIASLDRKIMCVGI